LIHVFIRIGRGAGAEEGEGD